MTACCNLYLCKWQGRTSVGVCLRIVHEAHLHVDDTPSCLAVCLLNALQLSYCRSKAAAELAYSLAVMAEWG